MIKHSCIPTVAQIGTQQTKMFAILESYHHTFQTQIQELYYTSFFLLPDAQIIKAKQALTPVHIALPDDLINPSTNVGNLMSAVTDHIVSCVAHHPFVLINQFVIKDTLYPTKWKMLSETKS